MNSKTYWNGQPCEARRVTVIVGKSPVETWWCAGMSGQKRKAVEITYAGETFYIDDSDNMGWHKVTAGRGAPDVRHRSLPVLRVVGERQYGVRSDLEIQ